MYEGWMTHSFPLVVEDEKHFLFRGTGLEHGDRIPRIVGYEYDRSFANGHSPEGLRIAARSPVLDVVGMPGWAEAATYRAQSGALVFGSATIEWVFGLGEDGVEDPRVGRMTANLIAEATSSPVPRTLARPLARVHPTGGRGTATVAVEGIEAPTDLAFLPDGTLVFSDARNHRLHRLQGDRVEILAGDGEPSSDPAFDDVLGPNARFFGPTGVATIENEIFVADTHNHCVRRIDPQGLVTTLAGALGVNGDVDGVGASARFELPMGLAYDPDRRLLLVADSGNGKLRAVDPASGRVTTLAGGGAFPADGPAHQVSLYQPTAVEVSPEGDIFVVDTRDRAIWRITPDDLATRIVSGRSEKSAGGDALGAMLSSQGGAAWDGGGLLVSEPSLAQIRRILPGAGPGDTRVETVAGPGPNGKGNRPFGMPLGLAVDGTGRIWVADPATASIWILDH
jgi:sugar lactone lactonase YvrE